MPTQVSCESSRALPVEGLPWLVLDDRWTWMPADKTIGEPRPAYLCARPGNVPRDKTRVPGFHSVRARSTLSRISELFPADQCRLCEQHQERRRDHD